MMRMIAAVRPHRTGLQFPYRMGSCAGSHADDRLRWRHSCIEQRCARGHAPHVRSVSLRRPRRSHAWQFRILELFDAMLSPWEFPDGSGRRLSCADSISAGGGSHKRARSEPIMLS